MTFVPNPYFHGTAPKTAKIVIAFITPENAQAQLLSGAVDLLDSTTVLSLNQTLVDAQTAGTIKLLPLTSATWEHIDINLFVK
jgi:ABC-type transport system substrate-binding protein